MKNSLYLFIITIVFSCNGQNRIVEKIDFKNHYRFSSEIENTLAKDTTLHKHQEAASEYASKGDYKNALIQWDVVMGASDRNYSKEQIDSINKKYTKVNATKYIIDQAKKNQIVIINEAHHNSFHRVYTKSLLKELYAIGYTNLGIEALSNFVDLDALHNITKYPTQDSGYYTTDPQFGNLIRDALAIGYTLFPYETENHEASGENREIDQANNIKKVIDARPNEKFLIYCGYDHALEGDAGSWGKAMAGRLEEFTGINPLTINQTNYSENSRLKLNHPFLKALKIEESTVLLDIDNKPLQHKQVDAYTDIVVFHPTTNYNNTRPDWLFKNDTKKVSIELKTIEIEYPVLVLAFKKGEDITKAVPVDIYEVGRKTELCYLGLKKGGYNIVVTNGKQSLMFDKQVN